MFVKINCTYLTIRVPNRKLVECKSEEFYGLNNCACNEGVIHNAEYSLGKSK